MGRLAQVFSNEHFPLLSVVLTIWWPITGWPIKVVHSVAHEMFQGVIYIEHRMFLRARIFCQYLWRLPNLKMYFFWAAPNGRFQILNCRYSFGIQSIRPRFCVTLVTRNDLPFITKFGTIELFIRYIRYYKPLYIIHYTCYAATTVYRLEISVAHISCCKIEIQLFMQELQPVGFLSWKIKSPLA